MNSDLSDDKLESVADFPKGVNVVVQCNGFRCLGYRDAAGMWRDAYTGRVLSNVSQECEPQLASST